MISLKHYRYFVNVVETGSFTQAAADSYISRQTLSTAVREIETEYKKKVFYLNKNVIHLTPFGEFLYAKSKNLLNEYDLLQFEAQRYSNINFSVDLSHELLSISPKLKQSVLIYLHEHPEVMLEFINTNSPDALFQNIDSSSISCGFVLSMSSNFKNFWSIPLQTFPVHAIVPIHHQLSNHSEISLAQLVSYPCICFGAIEVFYYPLYRTRIEQASVSTIIIEPNTLKASQFMTRGNDAIMLTVPSPEIIINYPNLRSIPVNDATWTLQLVGKTGESSQNYCKEFGNELKNNL